MTTSKAEKALAFFRRAQGTASQSLTVRAKLRSDSRQATLAKMTTSCRAKGRRPFRRRAQMTQNNGKMRKHLKRSGFGTKQSLFCRQRLGEKPSPRGEAMQRLYADLIGRTRSNASSPVRGVPFESQRVRVTSVSVRIYLIL